MIDCFNARAWAEREARWRHYQRPPLPFEPLMIEELVYLSSEMRLPRIVTWFANDCLTPEQLNRTLAEWWTSDEFPHSLGIRRLVRMFKAAGFVTDTEGVTVPTAPFMAFRGGATSHLKGCLWTLDEGAAAWFAQRTKLFRQCPVTVASAEIPVRHVLGTFPGGNEAEVVVNPFGLRGLVLQTTDADDPRLQQAAQQWRVKQSTS